jgi:hypothetical protein
MQSQQRTGTAETNLLLKGWQQICRYFYIDSHHFPDRRRRAEAVVALSFMIVYALTWFTYLPIYAFFFQNKVAAFAVGIIGLPTAVGALVIQRLRKNLELACALLNYGCVLTLIGVTFATGGTWSPVFFWLFSPIAGAYLLSGARHGISVTIIAAVGNAVVAFLVRPQLDPNQWFFQFQIFSSFHTAYFALTIFLSAVVFSLILYLFATKLKKALHESESAREELGQQKLLVDKSLETIQTQMLENKVIMNATEVAMVMIFPGMQINQEKTSAYFQKIFPGMEKFDKVLNKMNLESASTVLQSVIGESTLTWTMNESALPLKAIIDSNTHELEWRPIENDGMVSAIVFSAKNVQPLLDSMQKAENLNRYAKLLVSVVGQQDAGRSAAKEKRSRKILRAIQRQIPQVREAMDRAEISLVDNWQPIYITLHTLKGEMASFGFDDMKEFLHRTEDYVKDVKEALRASQGTIDSDFQKKITSIRGQLIVALGEIVNNLQEIQGICLQTGADQSSILISKDRLQVVKDDPQLLHELINDSLYEDIRGVIKDFEAEIYKVAGDLGKPPPRLLIVSGRHYLTDFAADKFRQSLTHIMRNMLDHGIETREERLQKGKSEIGEISFVVEDGPGAITVRIRDDGRGLNLGRIREKALNQGLIKPDQEYSSRELAELILLPGFSTTTNVSTVSGRGIGMEAASGFISDLNGSMVLHLLDESENPGLELRMIIPKTHIPVLSTASTGRLSA